MAKVGYSANTAYRKLSSSLDPLVRLRQEGLVPYTEVNGTIRYDAAFIDGLAAKIAIVPVPPGQKREPIDRDLVALYHLQYWYESLRRPRWNPHNPKEIAELVRRRDALLAADAIVSLDSLARAVKKSGVTARALRGMALNGRIQAVKLQHHDYYISARHSRYLQWVFNECPTISQAAEQHKTKYSALIRQINRRQLQTITGPDMLIHLPPETVQLLTEEGEVCYGLPEVAEALGKSRTSLRSAVQKGWLAATRNGRLLNVSSDLFTEVQQKLSTLNPGFEWIAQLRNPPTRTMTPARACRILGLSCSREISVWGRKNYLPYFVLTLSTKKVRRDYLAYYVECLSRYYGGGRISRQQVREYRQLCAQAKAFKLPPR